MNRGWRVLACASPLLAVCAQAAEPLEARMTLTWDGVTRDGAATEARIELRAEHDRSVRLETLAAAMTTTVEVDLAGAAPRAVVLPFRPARQAGAARVRITAPGSPAMVLEAALRVVPATRAIVAVAADGPLDPRSEPGIAWLATDPSALPRTGQAYETIDLLVLDAAALAALDPRQLRALEHHLVRCGRVLALRMPASALATVRRQAGCGGRMVAAARGASRPSVAALLAGRPAAMPGGHALDSLVDAGEPRRRVLRWLAAFAAAYVVVQGLCIALARPAPAAVVVALLGCAIAVLAWRSPPAHRSLTIWIESGPSERGRYVARLDVHGLAPGHARVTVPGSSSVVVTGGAAAVRRDANDGESATIEVETRLLSRTTIRLEGTLSHPPAAPAPSADPTPARRLASSRGDDARLEPLAADALPGFSGADSGAAWRIVLPAAGPAR